MRSRVQQCAEEVGGRFWRENDWVLFAFDGSRVSVPRTVSNEDAFCAANYGNGTTAKYRKKKTKGMRRTRNEKAKAQPQGPQIWITMVWHMGLRLPWTWRLGPSNSSERRHVEDILNTEQFPKKTLFCGDAGFVGFPLWTQLMLAKAEFRGLKQTQDNHKLCCRNSENAKAELEWSILAVAAAELLALRRQIPKKRKKNDDREYRVTDRSLAETVRAIRSSLTSPNDIPEPGKGLVDQLAEAIVQRYKNKTDKKSRYRPPNPDKKPLKDPEVRKINAPERKRLRELDMKIAA